METEGLNAGLLRRGSYDDAAVSLRPHFRNLAQRRRSAPSLVFGKTLGMSWSPIREESSCCVTTDQSPFVLGLTGDNGPLLLDQKLQVTEGSKTRERHLFLFRDVLVFAKLKSTASYRLKHKVNLEEAWVFGFDPELEDELPSVLDSDLDLGLSLVLAWDLAVCLLTFCSPDHKERWLNTLHRSICKSKARAGGECAPSDGHMKVLTGNIAVKSLSGVGMEHLIDLPINGNTGITQLAPSVTAEEKLSDNRWRGVVRRLRSSSSFIHKKKQLFGRPLSKVCAGGCLPKAILEILVLLRKRGPSTEGAFRKSCNNKKMQEVREQLESGAEVQLEEQPVALLVGLLKSFLKELPDSLLDTQLYERWMRAFNHQDPQQRAEELKRVLDDLPRPNVVLLQYLLCVLFHIQQNSHSNKMSAPNLAVCIGPTLLWSAGTPLDEQPDRMKEVADLTQFLIEHWEIVGDNIPNLLDTDEDSASSQHHDSAYDSTDPDGDTEQADSSTGDTETMRDFSLSNITLESSSSLTFKAPFPRRCSEPILRLSADSPGLCCHARSRDDCSMPTRFSSEQPLTKQSSADAILSHRRNSFFSQNNMDALFCHSTSRTRQCSCSSLDSAASNQSEGSVFTSSPVGSPTCVRKPSSTHFTPEKLEDKKRSLKVLLRARSFSRTLTLKKADLQSESMYPCETLQEDLQSEATSPKPRPLSAIEVFKHIDSRLLCEPPTYQQAVQNIGQPPPYSSMTVQDAIQLDRRSRPLSVNYDWPIAGHVERERVERAERVERRPRAMSESVPAGRSDGLLRRCSQPLFEEFSYAKESYV